MSKGKINYGRKRKTLDEFQDLGQCSKQDDKGIFDAVTEDMSEDFLGYINDLVKATKTPVKERQSREKLDGKPTKQIEKVIEPAKVSDVRVEKENSRRDMSDTDIYEKIQIKKEERPKFFSNYQPTNLSSKQTGSQSTSRLLRQLESRKSRQKTMPNLRAKDKLPQFDRGQLTSRTFLDCITEYISQLQSEQPNRTTKMDELAAQNRKLRKKLNLYEDKLKEIQATIHQHLDHLKNREKQYKSKIKQLTKALAQAVDKAAQQKDEIDYLQSFLNNFTHQVKAYKHSRTNKEKLTQLLKDESDDYNKFEDLLLKTLNSEDLKDFTSNVREVRKEEVYMSSDNQGHDTSQEHLAKIMNTHSFLPVTRTKPSRSIPRIDISKSRTRDSKHPFRKNTETTYLHKVCKFQESDMDQ